MEQTLPQGRYAIVGMDVIGTNLAAARLIVPGAFFRPGCLGRNAVGNVPNPVFTDGSLGVWGIINSVNLPALETFAIGANTTQTVYLYLVREGDWKLTV